MFAYLIKTFWYPYIDYHLFKCRFVLTSLIWVEFTLTNNLKWTHILLFLYFIISTVLWYYEGSNSKYKKVYQLYILNFDGYLKEDKCNLKYNSNKV